MGVTDEPLPKIIEGDALEAIGQRIPGESSAPVVAYSVFTFTEGSSVTRRWRLSGKSRLEGVSHRSGPAEPPLDKTREEEAKEQTDTLYHQPAFDGSNLLELFEGDEEAIATVLEIFIDDAPKQIELMKEALEAGDSGAVQRQAHSLRGAAGNVGACALEELSLQAENAGDAGDLEAAAAVVRTMDRALEELKTAVSAQIAGETSS